MKKILLATVALTVLGVPALAADLARPAPVYKAPPPPVYVYNWTGFYVGVNAGWGGENDPGYVTNLSNCNVAGVCGAGLIFGVPANQALASALGTGSGGRGNGFIGGFQAGYNAQFSNFLLGVEGDWDYFKRSHALTASGIATTGDVITVTNQSSATWLATVRGRAGLVWDRVLGYVTGGVAFSNISYTENMFTTLGTSSGAFSVSQTRVGWTVGAGVEFALWDNWTAKVEYLYAQFNGLTGNSALVSTVPPGFSNTFTGSSGTYRDNIVRFGLNYRFGGGAVVARY
jgi:outer membrane immunogenic protein